MRKCSFSLSGDATVSVVIEKRGEGRDLGYIQGDREDSTVKGLGDLRRDEADGLESNRCNLSGSLK